MVLLRLQQGVAAPGQVGQAGHLFCLIVSNYILSTGNGALNYTCLAIVELDHQLLVGQGELVETPCIKY